MLSRCEALEYLDLSENLIDGTDNWNYLAKCKNLSTIILKTNNLRWSHSQLQLVSAELGKMSSLKVLDVSNNPCLADMPSFFRTTVLYYAPKIKVLNTFPVTSSEKKIAKKLRGGIPADVLEQLRSQKSPRSPRITEQTGTSTTTSTSSSSPADTGPTQVAPPLLALPPSTSASSSATTSPRQSAPSTARKLMNVVSSPFTKRNRSRDSGNEPSVSPSTSPSTSPRDDKSPGILKSVRSKFTKSSSTAGLSTPTKSTPSTPSTPLTATPVASPAGGITARVFQRVRRQGPEPIVFSFVKFNKLIVSALSSPDNDGIGSLEDMFQLVRRMQTCSVFQRVILFNAATLAQANVEPRKNKKDPLQPMKLSDEDINILTVFVNNCVAYSASHPHQASMVWSILFGLFLLWSPKNTKSLTQPCVPHPSNLNIEPIRQACHRGLVVLFRSTPVWKAFSRTLLPFILPVTLVRFVIQTILASEDELEFEEEDGILDGWAVPPSRLHLHALLCDICDCDTFQGLVHGLAWMVPAYSKFLVDMRMNPLPGIIVEQQSSIFPYAIHIIATINEAISIRRLQIGHPLLSTEKKAVDIVESALQSEKIFSMVLAKAHFYVDLISNPSDIKTFHSSVLKLLQFLLRTKPDFHVYASQYGSIDHDPFDSDSKRSAKTVQAIQKPIFEKLFDKLQMVTSVAPNPWPSSLDSWTCAALSLCWVTIQPSLSWLAFLNHKYVNVPNPNPQQDPLTIFTRLSIPENTSEFCVFLREWAVPPPGFSGPGSLEGIRSTALSIYLELVCLLQLVTFHSYHPVAMSQSIVSGDPLRSNELKHLIRQVVELIPQGNGVSDSKTKSIHSVRSKMINTLNAEAQDALQFLRTTFQSWLEVVDMLALNSGPSNQPATDSLLHDPSLESPVISSLSKRAKKKTSDIALILFGIAQFFLSAQNPGRIFDLFLTQTPSEAQNVSYSGFFSSLRPKLNSLPAPTTFFLNSNSPQAITLDRILSILTPFLTHPDPSIVLSASLVISQAPPQHIPSALLDRIFQSLSNSQSHSAVLGGFLEILTACVFQMEPNSLNTRFPGLVSTVVNILVGSSSDPHQYSVSQAAFGFLLQLTHQAKKFPMLSSYFETEECDASFQLILQNQELHGDPQNPIWIERTGMANITNLVNALEKLRMPAPLSASLRRDSDPELLQRTPLFISSKGRPIADRVLSRIAELAETPQGVPPVDDEETQSARKWFPKPLRGDPSNRIFIHKSLIENDFISKLFDFLSRDYPTDPSLLQHRHLIDSSMNDLVVEQYLSKQAKQLALAKSAAYSDSTASSMNQDQTPLSNSATASSEQSQLTHTANEESILPDFQLQDHPMSCTDSLFMVWKC